MNKNRSDKKSGTNSDKSVVKEVWKSLASVKLAIVVLILIAVTSIIGTVIPQNAGDQFYLHKYGELGFKLFSMFDFFDMYHAWWFLFLLLLLVINLTACSIERLNKTWKIIFPKKISFNAERFRKNNNKESFSLKGDMAEISVKYKEFLSTKFKNINEKTTEESIAFFGETGRKTRLGVYIVHSSILLLLIGALLGGILGFKSHLNLNEGDSADYVVISQEKKEAFGFTIRCNTFDVQFYDTGAPKEFKSNISIIEDGKEVLKRDIIVNVPLRYKGINFFQSSYGTAPAGRLNMKIENNKSKMVYHQEISIGESFDLPEASGRFELIRYLPQFDFRGHNLGESFIGKLTKKDGKELMIVMPTRFPTFDKMRQGELAFAAEDFEKKYYTGLQVTHDPGVIYVYLGFVLMIAGCIVTFFMSHQSIMVEITKGKKADLNVLISGKANRNNQSMKIKIEKLTRQLKNIQSD